MSLISFGINRVSLSVMAHLEELHPALLLGLDALLHGGVGGDAHAAEGRQVLLAVLTLGLGVRQLDDAQAGVPQAARQGHQLSQGEGHHGGRLALAWHRHGTELAQTWHRGLSMAPHRLLGLSNTCGQSQGAWEGGSVKTS